MENNVFMMVVTHKDFNDDFIKNQTGYHIVKVGSQVDDSIAEKRGWLSDDNGENISDLNPYYCELTAIYWAWKNLKRNVDFVGLDHYRRYFLGYSASSHSQNNLISSDEIIDLLDRYQVLLPFESVKSKNMFVPQKSDGGVISQDINMGIVDQILKCDFPKYLDPYRNLIYGRNMVWKNMFITTREIFDDYCSFIFDVLTKYDRMMATKNEERIPRIDGFLAEYLTATYFYTNYDKKNIYRLDIIDPNEKCGYFESALMKHHTLSKITHETVNSIKRIR